MPAHRALLLLTLGLLPATTGAAAAPAGDGCERYQLPGEPTAAQLASSAAAAARAGAVTCAVDRWHRLSRLHLEAGDHTASRAVAERALQVARRSGEPVLEARLLNDRGNAHFYQLDYAAARADFEAALLRLGDADEPRLRVAVLQDLGITLANSGRPDLGLVQLHRAVELADRQLPGGAWPPLINNLGTVYEQLGAPPLAMRSYERALELAERSGSPQHRHDGLTRLGALRLEAGRVAAARDDLERALALALGFDGAVQSEWTLGYLAWARELDGDPEGAIAAQRQALALAQRLGYAPAERAARAGLAKLLLERDPPAARQLLSAGLAAAGPGTVAKVWQLEEALALWERRWGDGEQAVRACERALDHLEAWRERVGSLEARRGLQLANRGLYETCLGLLLERGDPAAAFHALERYRAPAWRRPPPAPAAERPELERRLAQLSERRARLAVDPEPGLAEPLDLEIDQLRLALGGVGAPPPAPTLPAARLASRLDGETALVAYGGSGDRLHAFLITRSGLAAVPLAAARSELAARVENFVELIARDRREGWLAAGWSLYQDVFAPVRRLIPEVRRLVVVADGELALLPFDALITAAPHRDPARPRFLLDELVIHYTPSAAAWAQPAGVAPQARGALVVGDPAPPAGGGGRLADVARASYEQEGFRPSPLPFARREAERLAARRSDQTVSLSGPAAGEAAVKQRLRAGAALVHFATHGFTSAWSDRRSALVLAPVRGEDGFLQARELRGMALRLDLVVLAACRSAAGQVRTGDQVRSLAHAFLDAGARSVIAALWDVPDRATYELTDELYAALAAGQPRADALRLAKQASRRSGAPPRAWAALVLIGEGEAPLAEGWRRRPAVGGGWLALGTIALVSAALWHRRWRRG